VAVAAAVLVMVQQMLAATAVQAAEHIEQEQQEQVTQVHILQLKEQTARKVVQAAVQTVAVAVEQVEPGQLVLHR
jgi:hypothetical protein